MASKKRNKGFGDQAPFEDNDSLAFHSATGTFDSMNPTRARFEYVADAPGNLHRGPRGISQADGSSDGEDGPTESQPLLGAKSKETVSFLWRSRDNRKGRHALLVPSSRKGKEGLPARTNTFLITLSVIRRMATHFPYWDLSWLVAVTFVLGSIVWVVNGFLVFLPVELPTNMSQEFLCQARGWTAFAGATIFFAASVLMMLEVLGASPAGCFGWHVQQTGTSGNTRTEARPSQCKHHHQGNRGNLVDEGTHDDDTAGQGGTDDTYESSTQRLLPTWHDIKTHYMYEISFVACSIQMLASTLFWVSKYLAIPQISERASSAVLLGIYWIPTIIGGFGFIGASLLLLLETQPRWYIPAPGVLGWHVCFWKLVGSIGFTLCGLLGPVQYADQATYFQSSSSTFWGSWAILIGSLIQWFESLDKHPVVEEGPSKTSEYQEESAKEED